MLNAAFPTWVISAPVVSPSNQTMPLIELQARDLALGYGFDQELYLERRSGMAPGETAALGLFAVFDGPHTLLSAAPAGSEDGSNTAIAGSNLVT